MASLQTLGIEGVLQELLINDRASTLAEEEQALIVKSEEVSCSLHAATLNTFNAWHYPNHVQKQAGSLAEWGHDPSNVDTACWVIDCLEAETTKRSNAKFGKERHSIQSLSWTRLKCLTKLASFSLKVWMRLIRWQNWIHGELQLYCQGGSQADNWSTAVLAEDKPEWKLVRGLGGR